MTPIARDDRQFRLPVDPQRGGTQPVTKSIAGHVTERTSAKLIEAGATVTEINGRGHVIARDDRFFYKSMTVDAARRLANFYPVLENDRRARRLVPRLDGIDFDDEDVAVARYQLIAAETGRPADSWASLDAYAELQRVASQRDAPSRLWILEASLAEADGWTEEVLGAWSTAHGSDPKILDWAHAPADDLRNYGLPMLERIGGLLRHVAPGDMSAPVHADLSVDNVLRSTGALPLICDWDEGYWGSPGMGLQILFREALDAGLIGDFRLGTLCVLAPSVRAWELTQVELLQRTLVSSVLEIAGIRLSLREMGRPPERHSAYLAAWACRYRWVIDPLVAECGQG